MPSEIDQLMMRIEMESSAGDIELRHSSNWSRLKIEVTNLQRERDSLKSRLHQATRTGDE